MISGWKGVDLDGTLAIYEHWIPGQIGEPVPQMLERVKSWLANGEEVRIFTARVGRGNGVSADSGLSATNEFIAEQRALIETWCLKHLGQVLPITCEKDFAMLELWDDRCVQVELNTGRIIGTQV